MHSYYTIGYAPSASRFSRQFLALFGIHQMALSLIRFIAAAGRTLVFANSVGTLSLQVVSVLGGFIVAKDAIEPWMVWGYYISPIMYGQNAIAMNEFLDKRWSQPNTDSRIDAPTIGKVLLKSIEAYIQKTIGIGSALEPCLAYGDSKAVIADGGDQKNKSSSSRKRILQGSDIELKNSSEVTSSSNQEPRRGMVLPFQPLSIILATM